MFGLQNQPPAKHAEGLSGLVERVTYFNEENGYAVLKIKTKGHRDNVTVVGGEWVTAEGHWVQDRKFGLQFRAEMRSPKERFASSHALIPLATIR